MVNPEIIQWRSGNPNFTNSVYQAVFGRNPTQDDLLFAQRFNAKLDLFMGVISSQEYQQRFGHLERKYFVYWKTRMIDTEQWGTRMCHCYYFAEFSDGYMPSMQYTGVGLPAGYLNFPVARALTLMCASFDRETCPHYDCGYADGGTSGDSTHLPSNTQNLVNDPNFAAFGTPSSSWGHNVLYGNNGIWWNSKNAQSTAQTVSLNGGNISTALHIVNHSSKNPHVYGTTAQRIAVVQGQNYEISFFGQAQDLASNGAVNIAIDPAWRIRPISMNAGTYNWTRFTGNFTAPDNYIDLRIISEDRGSVLITGMTLRPL